MNTCTDATPTPTLAETIACEAAAAERATSAEAKTANAGHVAELSGDTSPAHQAEHIRGLVAATMAQISVHASVATREHAANWQHWALAIADTVSGASDRHPALHGA